MPDKQPSPAALKASVMIDLKTVDHTEILVNAAIIDAEFAPLRAELDKLREENAKLREQLKKLTAEKSELSSIAVYLRAELDKLRAVNSELENRIQCDQLQFFLIKQELEKNITIVFNMAADRELIRVENTKLREDAEAILRATGKWKE